MKRRIFPVLFACMLLLTGCWDKVEISSRGYVINMGIDKDENGELAVYMGLAPMTDADKGGETEAPVMEIKGDNLSYIMKQADAGGSRRTYFGHTKSIIFGKGLLSDSALFRHTIDTLGRNQEINMKVLVLSSEDSVKEIVSAASENGGMYIREFFENNAENIGGTKKMGMEELLLDLEGTGSSVIPLVSLKNTITFGGAALIKDCGLSGFLDESGAEKLYLLLGEGEGTHFYMGDTSLEVTKNYRSIDFSEENGKLACDITLHIEGEIRSKEVSDGDILERDSAAELEEQFAGVMQKELQEYILEMGAENSGVFLKLVRELKKSNLSLYEKHINSHKGDFLTVRVHPDVYIKSMGMIS